MRIRELLENINESLDQPYKLDAPDHMYWVNKWTTTANSPTHTIKFLGQSRDKKKGPGLAWEFEFGTRPHNDRGLSSYDVTGEGDAQRVLATAVAAIKMFINDVEPASVTFTADKGDDGTSRTKLYQRMVQRLAPQMGFKPIVQKGNSMDTFTLVRKDQDVEENFADGKRKGKSRPGRVKRAGASCNGSVTSLRKRAKNASGEKAKMYHWCANMKSGRKKGK